MPMFNNYDFGQLKYYSDNRSTSWATKFSFISFTVLVVKTNSTMNVKGNDGFESWMCFIWIVNLHVFISVHCQSQEITQTCEQVNRFKKQMVRASGELELCLSSSTTSAYLMLMELTRAFETQSELFNCSPLLTSPSRSIFNLSMPDQELIFELLRRRLRIVKKN